MSAATSALNGTKPATKPAPINRDEFFAKGGNLPAEINGIPIVLDIREFKPAAGCDKGSFGWHYNGKVNVKIGGVIVPVQLGINATVCGSKLV